MKKIIPSSSMLISSLFIPSYFTVCFDRFQNTMPIVAVTFVQFSHVPVACAIYRVVLLFFQYIDSVVAGFFIV